MEMKRKPLRTGVVLFVLLVTSIMLFSACAQEEGYQEAPSKGAPVAPPQPVPAPAPKPGDDQSWATERMVIRTGNMHLVVNDTTDTMNQIIQLANNLRGFVVSSQKWDQDEGLAGTITIRVPTEHFDNAIIALRGMAIEVTSESTTAKDVTEEYVDLESRLKNLEATERQLLVIMEKAEEIQDILNVQRELTRVRGDIEQTIGRMQYLETSSDTSLIEVYLEEIKLEASFTAEKKKAREGERIDFNSDVHGGFAPYTYEWDFGDGETSMDRFPSHAYKSTGDYTVSLKVTDDRGNTNTEIRKGYITVTQRWSGGNTARSAWSGLGAFGRVLADIIIWIGIFSPVWVAGIAIWWWRRRKKKKSQQ